jgi:uncharacterized membrane protein
MIANRLLPFAALVLIAAIFGFFYAWVCSTMWGLDTLKPAIAIEAMQAMNASVRNAVFFPAFFLTPLVLVAAAIALAVKDRAAVGLWFGLAAAVYLIGGFGVTALVHVPMNQALAQIDLDSELRSAADIWAAYSDRWQAWNQIRAAACGLAVILTGAGLIKLGSET